MFEGLPLPGTDERIDAPFWEATLRGELAVQRCSDCGRLRFPPRPMCPDCRSLEHQWTALSGRGRVWSFVVPHPPLLPYFQKLAPYNVVLVELEEDPRIRMVGNLVPRPDAEINEFDPAAIRIGMPVRAVFRRVAEDVALLQWVPDEERS